MLKWTPFVIDFMSINMLEEIWHEFLPQLLTRIKRLRFFLLQWLSVHASPFTRARKKFQRSTIRTNWKDNKNSEVQERSETRDGWTVDTELYNCWNHSESFGLWKLDDSSRWKRWQASQGRWTNLCPRYITVFAAAWILWQVSDAIETSAPLSREVFVAWLFDGYWVSPGTRWVLFQFWSCQRWKATLDCRK